MGFGGFKRNIEMAPGFVGREPFWDKYGGELYSELNNVAVPDTAAIQQYQNQKLAEYMDMMMEQQIASHGQAAAYLNGLFQSGEINTAADEWMRQEDITLDEVITQWITMLNSTYGFATKNDSYTEKQYHRMNEIFKQLANYLQEVVNVLGMNNNKIMGEYLSKIQSLAQAAELTPGQIKDWIIHMTGLKGDTVEQIGTAWLNQKGAPNYQTITTGALEYRGSKYEHQGQLIQDLMMLHIESPDLLDSVEIDYHTAGGGEVKKVSLREFLKLLDSLDGSSKHIILEDNGYDALMGLSALNIQAKAGINQLPWNKNNSTSVSINDFDYDDLPLSAKRTFELLRSLDDEVPKDIWVKNTSNDYQALANYGLATALHKVLHMEANEGNQYLLTPSGFISFPERMKQLFKDSKYKAYIQGQIKFGPGVDTLGEKHTVNITGHS